MKEKLLFLAPRLPFPLDTGGKIRTYHILRLLASRYDVLLLCFGFTKDDKDYVRNVEALGVNVKVIDLNPAYVLAKRFAGFLLGRPVSFVAYFDRRMLSAVKKAISQGFLRVHCDHLHMAQYIPFLKGAGARFVVDEHNVEYVIAQRAVKVAWFLLKPFFLLQSFAVRKMERYLCALADEVWAVSETDCESLRSLSENNNVKLVPNGVDGDFFGYREVDKDSSGLVFIASMDWLPNEDACLYMAREIMPLIWERDASIRLFLVGRNPSERVKGLSSDRVVITGSVEDVREFAYNARVYVAPLRFGSGTRLKILEAMAMGRPIVSTSLGAEGIDYTDGKDILIADSPEAFAEKVMLLYRDQDLCNSIGLNARRLVEERYVWRLPE